MLSWERLLNCTNIRATVIHTCAPRHLPASAVAARAATAAAEAKKTTKYLDLSDRFNFRPFAVETLEAFGASALELVDSLASRIHAQTGEQGARGRIFRRLSTVVQSGNVRRIVEAHSQASAGRFRPFSWPSTFCYFVFYCFRLFVIFPR